VKVALVLPGGVDRSGTERVIPAVLWLITRIARVHELHVFALSQESRPGRWTLLGAAVHNAGRPWSSARTVRAIVREHSRDGFDLVHALWAVPAGVAAAAAAAAIRRPFLVHVAGGEPADLPDIDYGGARTARGRLLLGQVLARAAVVTVASAPMEAAVASFGVRAVRVPLGVDLETWPPASPRPRDPVGPARLVHVASLNRVKDQDTLLRAAARLARAGIAFTLDVIGGDTLDGAHAALAARLELNERVTFHGFLPQPRVRTLVEAADVMVISSRHEAGPVAVLEAAAAGVPTAGTAVGHIADWAPEAAVAVPVGDAAALASAIAGLISDDGRRLRIAHAAQARAVAEDADDTARRMLALYETVASRRALAHAR
jgi:glycosyltransferase involved in cell wall biosynthesis